MRDPTEENKLKTFLEIFIQGYVSKVHLIKIQGFEALSAPFELILEVWPEDIAEFNALITGKAITVCLNHETVSQYYHGIIQSIHYVGIESGEWSAGKLTVMPKLSLLSKALVCRQFVNKTVPQILVALLRHHGIEDYDVKEIGQTSTKLPYCVQYQESDFSFMQRLLANCGIYYFFKHTVTGSTLVFSTEFVPDLRYGTVTLQKSQPEL